MRLVETKGAMQEQGIILFSIKVKVQFIPQQAEVAPGVPGRLRPRIFVTFGTTRVIGHQPYAPAVFTPRKNPW
jgi:hypothetical protein